MLGTFPTLHDIMHPSYLYSHSRAVRDLLRKDLIISERINGGNCTRRLGLMRKAVVPVEVAVVCEYA